MVILGIALFFVLVLLEKESISFFKEQAMMKNWGKTQKELGTVSIPWKPSADFREKTLQPSYNLTEKRLYALGYAGKGVCEETEIPIYARSNVPLIVREKFESERVQR